MVRLQLADDIFKIRNKAQFVHVKASHIELFLIIIIIGSRAVDLHVVPQVSGGGE